VKKLAAALRLAQSCPEFFEGMSGFAGNVAILPTLQLLIPLVMSMSNHERIVSQVRRLSELVSEDVNARGESINSGDVCAAGVIIL